MGNHRRFRLALNTTVWISLCWCLLLDPANILNYWQTDGALMFNGNRTNIQKLCYYVFIRAVTFFNLMDNEMRNQAIDGTLFLTESLLKLLQLITMVTLCNVIQYGKVKLQKKNEIILYENALKEQVFEPTLKDYPDLRKLYQKDFKINKR